jgi:short-subunit dehydrogenase
MSVTKDGRRPAKGRSARPRHQGRVWLPQPDPGFAALVTGASSGLGSELARSLAARGHNLVLVARRRDRLDTLARALAGPGVQVHVVDCDLTEPGAGRSLAAAVAERGLEISVLCNNAGAAIAGEFAAYRAERQVAVLRLDLEAVVDLCGHFVPLMVRRGSGAVLNVGSLFSWAPAPRLATYAASKAAVLSFTEALHTELRPYGVAVTALCPGTMPTEFMEHAGLAKALRSMPSPALDDPRVVAERGIWALERNRRVLLPSARDRSTAAVLRRLPHQVTLALLHRWPLLPHGGNGDIPGGSEGAAAAGMPTGCPVT